MTRPDDWLPQALRVIAEQGKGEIVRCRGNTWTYAGCRMLERRSATGAVVQMPEWSLPHVTVIELAGMRLVVLRSQLPGKRATNAMLTQLGWQRVREGGA